MSSTPIATIEAIASRAGVSPGTVSRVLNGKNKENRPAIARRSQLIRDIALELGYRPNQAARSIQRGQFLTIAFVSCGDFGFDWFPRTALHGMHEACEESGYRLVFHDVPAATIQDSDRIPTLFRESAFDGVIVNLDATFSDTVVPYFESQPIPCAWLNLKRPHRCVYPDDVGGGRRAARYLIEKGHREIGMVLPVRRTTWHFSERDRKQGVLSALREAGLRDDRVYQELGDNPQVTPEMAEKFLRAHPEMTAVVAYEDVEAIALRTAAAALGRRVPEDFEIIGFHERELHARTGLYLPTLMIPFVQIGRQVTQMLIRMIQTRKRDVPSEMVEYPPIVM